MGGYVITYPGDLHYLTIRGSGHMVPVRSLHGSRFRFFAFAKSVWRLAKAWAVPGGVVLQERTC